MKSKGLLSRDFFVLAFGLIFAVVTVGAVYRNYVWPKARDIEIASQVEAAQNPDKPIVADRSAVMILKDMEQMFILMMMGWATIIMGYKFLRLRAEKSAMYYPFLNISTGERILPEESLAHYKDLEAEVREHPRLHGLILPEVVLAALHRFDSTRSIQDASHAVQERTEVAYEQLESDLSLLRYIAWAIPSIGFIGTVRGIGIALAMADQAIKGDISGVTAALGLAFNSTLVALLISMVLVFGLHMLQSAQEKLLIDLGEFADRRIIALMKSPATMDSQVTYT